MRTIILTLFLAATISITLPSCSNSSEQGTMERIFKRYGKKNKVRKLGKRSSQESQKEYESKYICVKHCKGSGNDIGGTCPVCGSEYVLNEE